MANGSQGSIMVTVSLSVKRHELDCIKLGGIFAEIARKWWKTDKVVRDEKNIGGRVVNVAAPDVGG